MKLLTGTRLTNQIYDTTIEETKRKLNLTAKTLIQCLIINEYNYQIFFYWNFFVLRKPR